MAAPRDIDETAAAVEAGSPSPQDEPSDGGGESACFAHLVCPDCGVVVGDGPHRPGCKYAA